MFPSFESLSVKKLLAYQSGPLLYTASHGEHTYLVAAGERSHERDVFIHGYITPAEEASLTQAGFSLASFYRSRREVGVTVFQNETPFRQSTEVVSGEELEEEVLTQGEALALMEATF